MPVFTKLTPNLLVANGMRELAIADPDGYVITFAERVDG
jgi:hypothetical protein